MRRITLPIVALGFLASGCKTTDDGAGVKNVPNSAPAGENEGDGTPATPAQPVTPDAPATNVTEGAPQGPYQGPPGGLDDDANFALWSQYCKGEKLNPGVLPQPNYQNDEVLRAAKILGEMNPHSFALYGQINIHYKKAMASKPAEVQGHAHEFLVYLCGEFRDRAGMVQAKTRWILNTNYVPTDPQPQIDPKKNPWLQMHAALYAPYLKFSYAFYQAKLQRLQSEGKHKFGSISGIDKPVMPQTVCETKHMFASYLDENKEFPGLEQWDSDYASFDQANCTNEDRNDYYDFRGDGNFKPNSPESNGMIWHAISTSLQCKDTVTRLETPKPGQQLLLPADGCKEYFTHPFLSRWAGARAGLGTWLLHERQYDETFRKSNQRVDVHPNWTQGATKGPHDFVTAAGQGTFVQNWQAHWLKPTLGLYELSGDTEGGDTAKQFLYEQIRNSVDRHTDWYASGYDDLMKQKRERDQAYSPFVASSYEMSASDAFVAPCYTIPCTGEVPARNWKHYMFIFRVHKDNYYSTDDLAAGKKIDFDNKWYDETTFGTTGLAKSERAWDRLGTALETELDSILYLHHICKDGSFESPSNKCDQ